MDDRLFTAELATDFWFRLLVAVDLLNKIGLDCFQELGDFSLFY
jgi:hypothetical protein